MEARLSVACRHRGQNCQPETGLWTVHMCLSWAKRDGTVGRVGHHRKSPAPYCPGSGDETGQETSSLRREKARHATNSNFSAHKSARLSSISLRRSFTRFAPHTRTTRPLQIPDKYSLQ